MARSSSDPAQTALKALSLRRRQLCEMIAVEKTHLGRAVEAQVAASHRAVLAALAAALAEVERELDRRIDADDALAHRREILLSVPGLDRRGASVVITDLPELGAIDHKAAASLAGLSPRSDESGRSAISGGRPCVRAVFFRAGMLAVRGHPHFRASYRAKRADGKPPKVAIVATGRRLVNLANALVRDDRLFDDGSLASGPVASRAKVDERQP